MKKFFLVGCLAVFSGCLSNDSDPSPSVPSGLTVRQDALTGCEYLEAGHGITPRMDADGKQVCRKVGAPWASPTSTPSPELEK